MNCDQARRLLSDRLDQPLPPDQSAALRAHLAGCRECRAFERELTARVVGLESLPRSLPSPRVRAGVQAYVDRHDDRVAQGLSGTWLRQVGAFVGAAAVLVAVAAFMIVLLNGRTTGPPLLGSSPVTVSPTSSARVTSSVAVLNASPAAATPAPWVVVGTPPVAPVTSTATPSPVAVTQAVARTTVTAYFDAINRHDYPGAYRLLGADLQGGQSLDQFAAGFATTAHDAVTIVGVAPEGGDLAVSMVLIATQTDGSVRSFSGRYLIGVESGSIVVVGADVHEDTPAAAATPAATAAALPPCSAGGLEMALSAQGATGNVALAVVFRNHGAPCQLAGALTLSISGQSGAALPIQGNAEAVPLNIVVGNVEASATFMWSNWCGSERQFVVSAVMGGKSARLDQAIAPRCDAASAPSQLRVVSPVTWAGTVVANTPGTGAITLHFPDGTTRRVVVGNRTVVTDAHGDTVRAADIQAGNRVSASGDVSADATAMDAAVVVVQP